MAKTKILAPVTEAEQPYPLPEGWVWVRLGSKCTLKNGEKLSGEELPYLDVKYLRGNSEAKFVDDGAVVTEETKVILVDGENSGEIFTIPERGYMGSTFRVLGIDDTVLPDYAMFFIYLNHDSLKSQKTGSAIPHLNKTLFGNLLFPLPSIPTQQKIVAQIESLFEKLDRAKELLQQAQESFATRRAAILHKAFTGELTAKWRTEHGVGLGSWEEKTLIELCNSLQYGTSKKSEKSGRFVVLRMGNLQDGEIDWSDLAYTNDVEDIEKLKLSTGDVLFNRTNSAELVGKTSIYRGEMPAIFAGYLIRINYEKECLDGYYLNYVMNSLRAKEYCHAVKTDAVNQSNINAKKLGAFVIPVPTLPEQQEIVRILDGIFEQEKKAQELADVAERIDLMKKAILAKAFRGELS